MSEAARELKIKVPAVILAAGASRRLGEPKQLVMLGGEALLERAIRVAREAGLEPMVVLGANVDRILQMPWMQGVDHVLNPEWPSGMGGSIAVGVSAVGVRAVNSRASMLVVMTCDQPMVTAEHLHRLVTEGADGRAVASLYAGRRGVPACLPRSLFGELSRLQGDAGARELLASARALALPGGEVDIDTVEALERVRAEELGIAATRGREA